MDIQTYWQHFKDTHPAVTTDTYDAYALGNPGDVTTANQLAALIKAGTKTATTSVAELYEPNEPLPQVGDYSLILDGHDQPVCVTETMVVEIVPFNLVSAEHAYHEGEGSRTLSQWRTEHRDFFQAEYAAANRDFNDSVPCVCEVFRVVG